MPFQITVHQPERILEVVYPPQPSQQDVDEYLSRVKDIIEGLGEWSALVDQSQLRVMPGTMVAVMAKLNAFAQLKGMKRSARVVSTAASGLQAWRMTKQAMLNIPARTFETRDEALAWLKNPDDE
ncbi:STAS/SEC14 domain-containing protein [Stigmatella sp. ncwal1]|uniref:STAS/SEC14 domain-containing protein n=1 Tax=Stigmatella ashevillensis TaxID=2995309 RepID=A0ABT5DL31_9BACT|nr:STAS/SEC14 domain-containing protein [Stigmatella ashevillena]MDC0714374.1 STAS/SEC14 domain-containing protein [Stigmatella ashevillena]